MVFVWALIIGGLAWATLNAIARHGLPTFHRPDPGPVAGELTEETEFFDD